VLGQKSSSLVAWGVALALGAGCGEKFSEGMQASGGAGSSSGGSDSTSAGKASDGGKSSAGAGMNGGSGGRNGGSGGTSPNDGGKGGTDTTVGGSLPIAAMGGEGGDGGVPVVVVPNIPSDGLELWFDASRGVGQVNGIVSTWADQSGHHRDALQTANNLRPRLVADALAGKPAIVFDGAVDGDYLKLPTLDVDFAKGVSIFVAAQQAAQPDVTPCEGFFEASNGSEIDDIHVGTWQKSLIFEVYQDYINDTNFPLLFDEPQLIAAILAPSHIAQVRRNSNGVGSGQLELPVKIARTEVFLGRTLYGDCAPLKGVIGEVILYSRAVTDPELIQIESYLQKRWGCCTE
jgi:hypothetical protein